MANQIRPSSSRRPWNASRAAFKVYSEAPLSSLACKSIRDVVSTVDGHPHDDSLAMTLLGLQRVVAQVHSNIESARSVFLQLFKDVNSLKPLKLPWGTLRARSRQWNIYCETYRAHSSGNICLPKVRLAILRAHFDCVVQQGPFKGLENYMQVIIEGDLRPEMLQVIANKERSLPRTNEHATGQTMQDVVDDVLRVTHPISQRRDLTDHVQLIEEVLEAVSSSLKDSLLGLYVRFTGLEIVLEGPKRERYVSHTLLSSDGSQRSKASYEQTKHGTDITIADGHCSTANPL